MAATEEDMAATVEVMVDMEGKQNLIEFYKEFKSYNQTRFKIKLIDMDIAIIIITVVDLRIRRLTFGGPNFTEAHQ